MPPGALFARAMVSGWTPGRAMFGGGDEAERELTVPERETRQGRRRAAGRAAKAATGRKLVKRVSR